MDGQEFADLRDHEILDTVERLGSHLENMGSKLPDHGAKLRARIQRLKEEFSRRQELHSPAPLRTAVTAHSSTGRSPELAPAPPPASPSTSPHPVPVNSSTGSNPVLTPAPSPASPSTSPHPVPPENKLRIFSGTANLDLSREIANYLGLELGKIKIESFANGDMSVQLPKNVEGCDVYLVQSICSPINENLAELLGMMNACRRSSVKNITAVIPYLGDARWDCTIHGRESPGASLVAKRITEAGASRVIACDLHSKMSKGYFDIPVDHVYGSPVLVDYLAKKGIRSDDLVVVSPAVKGASGALFLPGS